MSKSKDKVVGELELLRHIVSETARMSYPGRFGGKLRAGAKKAIQAYFESEYPESLQEQIVNYDDWHINRVRQLGDVIRNRNFRQNEQDKFFALSAKLVNTFMHQLMKYDRFRYLYKSLHLPLDGTVFQRLLRREYDHNELQNLRNLVRAFTNCAYKFGTETYVQIQGELWGVVNYFNVKVLPENCRICSRIDLNCLLC